METIFTRPITEAEVDTVIAGAGGGRAHTDADSRLRPGVDYRVHEALIELKMLDQEGISKPERQGKLAALFQAEHAGRPVVVLDRDRLSTSGQLEYDRILEGPIQRAVRKASQQLKESRTEIPDTTCSVILVVNNGYTALDHESLCRLVARRVRQDTRSIDGIVVAGCYFHADGFDYSLQFPFEYIPVNLASPFPSFALLKGAWFDFTEQFATAVVRGTLEGELHKGPLDRQTIRSSRGDLHFACSVDGTKLRVLRCRASAS